MQYKPHFYLASRLREQGNNIILHELEREGIKGIAPSHGDILLALFQEDGCSMGKLAERIRRTKSTVTTLVSKLETHGYVVRARSEEDGRGTSVFLTEKGHSLRPVLDRISLCLERYINARLSDQEALQLEKLLRKLLGDSIPLPSASDSADDRAKPLEVRN